MSALLFELCRLRKAETKHVHSATLDNIAYPKKSRHFSLNQYADTLLLAICEYARYCNIRDSIIGKKRAPQYLREFAEKT